MREESISCTHKIVVVRVNNNKAIMAVSTIAITSQSVKQDTFSHIVHFEFYFSIVVTSG